MLLSFSSEANIALTFDPNFHYRLKGPLRNRFWQLQMLNLDVIVEKGQKGKVIKNPVKAFIVGLLYVVLQVSDHYWIVLS